MITGFLTELEASGATKGTLTTRRNQLAAFDARYGLATATRDDIVQWLAEARTNSTRKGRKAALVKFYAWAEATGRIPTNPATGLMRVSNDITSPRPCPEHVIQQALADATDPRVYAAIVLGRYAGLRAMEIAACHTSHLDGRSLWVAGKGRRERVIPAHPLVVDVVTAAAGWVMPSRKGGHARPHVVTHWVSAALPGRWTCHSLRHAFGTSAYELSGHDLLWVARLMGHSQVSTTAMYVATQPGGLDIIERMAS